VSDIKTREVAIQLLRMEYEDEIAHLRLRVIRDRQEPRFKAIKAEHPEIFKDFMLARTDIHETLLRNRRTRQEVLRVMAEGRESELVVAE